MSEKKYITWTDRYSVNIEKIDDQHKMLFDLTNQLYEAVVSRSTEESDSVFQAVLKKLVHYVKTHFAYEEALMESHQYPGLVQHKHEHANFVKEVLESVRAREAGKSFVPNRFVRFLRDWLLHHIAITDKEYQGYLAGKNVK